MFFRHNFVRFSIFLQCSKFQKFRFRYIDGWLALMGINWFQTTSSPSRWGILLWKVVGFARASMQHDKPQMRLACEHVSLSHQPGLVEASEWLLTRFDRADQTPGDRPEFISDDLCYG